MSLKVVFSSEDDKVLSELVGCHPCLYDLKHSLYKDQTIRDNVWKQFSNELNKPVEDCKKRWRNIKDTYNKKRRGRTLDVLSFMDKAIYERQSITNVTNEGEALIFNNDDNVSSHDNSVFTQKEPVTENITLPTVPTEPIMATENMLEIKLKGKKRQKKNEAFIDVLNKRSEERNCLFQELTKTEEEEDPIDVFFRSMALTVKQFSPELKIKVKMVVFKIINELELQNLKPSDLQTSDSSNNYMFPEDVTSRAQALYPINYPSEKNS
ncbi:hypothetical protein QTP88_016290 [Uroleucon formosanum]